MTTLKADNLSVITANNINFTQNPTLPTAPMNDNTTKVSNTAYVQSGISNYLPKIGDITVSGIKTLTGTVSNLQAPTTLTIGDGVMTGLSLGNVGSIINMRGVTQKFDSTWQYMLTSLSTALTTTPSLYIQSGTFSWTSAAPLLTFPIQFLTIPTLIITAYNGVNNQTFSPQGVTVSSAAIRCSGTTSTNVNWLAIG
jgi:hypothetical protein